MRLEILNYHPTQIGVCKGFKFFSSSLSEKNILDKSLFNFILQEKIKVAIKNHADRGISLDIPIFLEGLSIYHGGRSYTSLNYSYFKSILKDASGPQPYGSANLLVMSKQLEDVGGSTCIYHRTGIYDTITLAKHLSILRNYFLSYLKNTPVVFEINSINHSTFLIFNIHPKPSWTFVDINNLKLIFHPFENEKKLAESIVESFAINHQRYVSLETRTYTLNTDAFSLRNILQENILTNESWQLIHNPNYLIDLEPTISLEPWLLIAANSNDFQTLNQLLSIKKITTKCHDQNYINVNYQQPVSLFSALCCAATSNSSEALELLLSHPEIDINIKDIYGKTPFRYAVEYNCLDAVKLFYKHVNLNIESYFENLLWVRDVQPT